MIFFHWAIVMAGFGNEIGEFDLFLYIQFNNWYLTSILVFHALLYDTPINFLRQGLISLPDEKTPLSRKVHAPPPGNISLTEGVYGGISKKGIAHFFVCGVLFV